MTAVLRWVVNLFSSKREPQATKADNVTPPEEQHMVLRKLGENEARAERLRLLSENYRRERQ